MTATVATVPQVNRLSRNSAGSMTGFAERRSRARKAASSIADPASSAQVGGAVQPCSWPLMTPQTRPVTAPADSSAPGASSGGAAGLRDSGISTAPAARVAQTAGTLIQNTECQEKCCSSRPPSTGPSGRPSATAAARMPMALGRSSSSPNAAETTARDSGNTIPAPSPISARAAISSPAETDSAHHSDAARNTASPASSSRLRPRRSPITPAGSMTAAKTSW